MNAIFSFLYKAIILPFYRRNTGFFLLFFVLFFGIVPNVVQYHYRLMKSITSSVSMLAVYSLVLILYNVKGILFILKKQNDDTLFCIKNMQVLPVAKSFLFWFFTYFIVSLPFFIYTILTIVVGFNLHEYVHIVFLAGFLLFLNIAGAAFCQYSLFRFRYTLPEIKLVPAFLSTHKLFFPLLCWHSYYNGKMKFFLVKFISLCLLFIPLIWNQEHFDFGDFILFFHLSIASHALVVFDYVQFLERRFILLRNLPIATPKIFLLFSLTMFFVVLPESIVLLYFRPQEVSFITSLGLIVYLIGLFSLFIMLSYETGITLLAYTSYIGLIIVATLLLSPFRLFIFTGMALFAVSLGMFKNLYYKYELKTSMET